MRGRSVALLLTALLAASPLAAAEPSPIQAMVVGITSGGHVLAAGVPLTSGPWGTDYITVSHVLGVGRSYAVVGDGQPSAGATPIAACSSHAHGIDVLLLRVASHPHRAVVRWGDPAELRRGDELTVFVLREFHPTPVRVRFLHLNLLEWTGASPDQWPPQWHHVMVGQGTVRPGFSGSPWVRHGRVYGLLKGVVRIPGQDTWVAAAETATKVRQCLLQVHYADLLPRE